MFLSFLAQKCLLNYVCPLHSYGHCLRPYSQHLFLLPFSRVLPAPAIKFFFRKNKADHVVFMHRYSLVTFFSAGQDSDFWAGIQGPLHLSTSLPCQCTTYSSLIQSCYTHLHSPNILDSFTQSKIVFSFWNFPMSSSASFPDIQLAVIF